MRICIIHTGGTIGCTGTPLAPLPAADFTAAVQRLLGAALAERFTDLSLHVDAGIRFDGQTGTLDSTDLRPRDWCRMAARILDLHAEFDGFVLLHGTDTMDYTAAALSFLLNVPDRLGLGRAVLSKPVILTGAQLPLFREAAGGPVLNAGSDGFANLCGALACARLRIPEVALYFDGRLWRGNRALKVSTQRFSAFDSPHLPPLAEAGIALLRGPAPCRPGPAAPALALDDPAARALARDQLHAAEAGFAAHPVVRLPALPCEDREGEDMLAGLVDLHVSRGAKGIILEGHGEGNLPAGGGALAQALRRAHDRGVAVVIGSRAIGGRVGAFIYAAGAWVAGTGAVSAGDMTPVATVAKLMILLAVADHHGWDGATLAALLSRDLAGECAATDRLEAGATLWPGQTLRATDGGATLRNDPEAGLVLHDRAGRALWSVTGPGRLVLRDRPVFLGPDGAALWTATAALPGGILILGAGEGRLLALHDPAGRAAPVVLVPG